MFHDFINLRRLDRSARLGRMCQLLGFAAIAGPIANMAVRAQVTMPGPNLVLESLPSFNPAALAFRHPLWLLPFNIVLGSWLILVGSHFLQKRPWALSALRNTCWACAGISLFAAALFGASISGPVPSAARIFGAGCTAMAVVWAIIIARVARELNGPEYKTQFGTSSL